MALGGAVQEIVKESYDELTKRGHKVVIISPHPKQGDPTHLTQKIVYIGRAGDPKSPLGTVGQVSTAKNSEIDGVLRREKFDVIHMHEPWVPLSNRQILKRVTCPVVATFHAKLPDNWVASAIKTVGRVYTAPILKHINICVAVSDSAAEHISAVLRKPVQIIPNAVNLSAFTPATKWEPIDPDKKTLLYVGRLEARKGVTHLLKAFKVLHEKYPDTQLLIGGNGPDRAALEKQAIDEGTGDVLFLGYLEDAHKKELLQRADLFCAPAIYGESFGVILIEALASGQVVVAGNNPGYISVMKDFGEVSLVNPRDIQAHAALLEKLLYDEGLRAKYRTWAQTYVKQYDYPVVTDQYEAIYKRLVAENDHGHKA